MQWCTIFFNWSNQFFNANYPTKYIELNISIEWEEWILKNKVEVRSGCCLKGWQINNPLPEQAWFKAKVKTSTSTVKMRTVKDMLTVWGPHEHSWWPTHNLVPLSIHYTTLIALMEGQANVVYNLEVCVGLTSHLHVWKPILRITDENQWKPKQKQTKQSNCQNKSEGVEAAGNTCSSHRWNLFLKVRLYILSVNISLTDSWPTKAKVTLARSSLSSNTLVLQLRGGPQIIQMKLLCPVICLQIQLSHNVGMVMLNLSLINPHVVVHK